jgi:hypothetical protein
MELKRRAEDKTPKDETVSEFKPPVIVSGFDRWLRLALFTLNCAVLLVMLWVLANVDRNYRFGTGNRDMSCAVAKVVQEQFPDPELRFSIQKNCK